MEYFKPFFVKIAGRARDDDHTSAHEQIIAPLLQNALAAYVYNGRKDSIVGAFGSVEHPLNLSEFSFLVRERGKFRLDLSRECVNGAEIFWNACSFRRGSVVVLLEGEFDMAPILRRCAEISIYETPIWATAPQRPSLPSVR
ncbi:hypothetical protein [uncultured Campylobacter sp.]|uniref:hypothetical protein n=1 Tax=uncultured Campylobacter sp. TaxID=218934 RepID=UPI002623E3A4|nr:hypothetical protein [uncultured Campylobacter sp.]